MQKQLLKVFGVGGHSKVVIDTAKKAGFIIELLFDDNPIVANIFLYGTKVLYPIDNSVRGNGIIAIGDNTIRKKISLKLDNIYWEKIIHPSTVIADDVEIGEGTVIMAGCVIQPGSRIGKHCIINTGSCIDHDCVIGNFSHIAPNCSIAGGVFIDEGTFIGIGSSIIQNIKIGAWCKVGAGSVVICNLESNCTAVGAPAKIIKYHYEQ